MHGGEDGGGEGRGGAPMGGLAGLAGPPTAWPDGTPAGGPPLTWPDGTSGGGPGSSVPRPSPALGVPGVAWAPPADRPPTSPLSGGWPPAVPPTPPGPSGSRGRGLLVALAVLAVIAAVAAAIVVLDPMGQSVDETAASWRADADPEDLGPVDDTPTRPTERSGETTTTAPAPTTAPPPRLAPAPTAPAVPGPFAFLVLEDDGDPITWDPCETIQYVVNSRTAPAEGQQLLAEALAKITAATGLVFEDRGATDEAPTADLRPQTDPRYGEGWSPVLIAWTDPGEVAGLGDGVAGLAAPDVADEGGGEGESVTGIIHLDGPQIGESLAAGERVTAEHVVLHELGHLVGLDHVEDTSQVMYHNRDGMGEIDATWNDGDLAGLAQLGNGPCNPDV